MRAAAQRIRADEDRDGPTVPGDRDLLAVLDAGEQLGPTSRCARRWRRPAAAAHRDAASSETAPDLLDESAALWFRLVVRYFDEPPAFLD